MYFYFTVTHIVYLFHGSYRKGILKSVQFYLVLYKFIKDKGDRARKEKKIKITASQSLQADEDWGDHRPKRLPSPLCDFYQRSQLSKVKPGHSAQGPPRNSQVLQEPKKSLPEITPDLALCIPLAALCCRKHLPPDKRQS